MRILFFSLLLLGSLGISFSQSKSDSIEFYYFFENAYKLRNKNVDSAFYWINKAAEISQSLAKREWRAKVYNLKGVLYRKKNNYYSSIAELEKALRYTTDKDLRAKIYINLGNTLSDLNYSHSAKECYEKSVKLFNETQNYQFLIRALLNLATEEFNLKQMNVAKNHLKLALYYSREYGFIEEEANCLNNLAVIYITAGQIDSASWYVYQSFNNYEQLENYYGLADAYLTAIELHLNKKELNYAKGLIDIADSIIDHLNYLEGKKHITSQKVNYYLLRNDVKNVAKYFEEYLMLEDSLNKKITDASKITINNHELSMKDYPQTKYFADKFVFIEIFLIVLGSIFIVVALFNNYRDVKE